MAARTFLRKLEERGLVRLQLFVSTNLVVTPGGPMKFYRISSTPAQP
jgi:hypothetical protein